MSTVIAADRDRVWRALTEPCDIVAWDEHFIEPIDPTGQYPRTGETLRWRYRLGSTPVVLKDTPRTVKPGSMLVSRLQAGSLRLERTYTLFEEPEDRAQSARTRLAMKLVADNTVPVIGEVIDRFEVRRMTVEGIDESLRAVQKWCENAT